MSLVDMFAHVVGALDSGRTLQAQRSRFMCEGSVEVGRHYSWENMAGRT